MSIPTSRDEFSAFCLRALGDGVLQINVSPDQVDDRIDEALYVYQQFHMDAVVHTYLKHEISPSVMHFTDASGAGFSNGEVIIGLTTNTHGMVYHAGEPNANAITFTVQQGPVAVLETGPPNFTVPEGQGTFAEGEQVRGWSTGTVGTIATSNANAGFVAVEIGDFDNKWLPVPNYIIGVNKIFAPFDSRISADILFDPQSQFNISLLSNFTSNSIIPYVMGRQYQQLLNDTFRGRPQIRFQRHMNRVYVDVSFNTNFFPGQFIIIDCYRTIDPNDYPAVWSDRWLQRYATQLLKRQWGSNLSKYNGIKLPGDVELDGKTMFTDAETAIKNLEQELKDTYQLPIDFLVG